MNLSELQAFLEDSNWDDESLPVNPSKSPALDDPSVVAARDSVAPVQPALPAPEDVINDTIPTLIPDPDLHKSLRATPVKLVPRPKEDAMLTDAELKGADSLKDRLMEVEMAQRMGYLLCKCTWPPQIMVLTGTDHVYRCRRCSRVREM